MIIGLLLKQVHTFIQSLLGVLPTWTFTIDPHGWVSSVSAYLWNWDVFVPLHDGLLPVMAIWIAVFGVLFGIRVGTWIMNVFRGSGAR